VHAKVEPLAWAKIKPFMGISLLFCACLWTNVKALEFANVETVIVFRAMSPIAVALCDYWCVLGEKGGHSRIEPTTEYFRPQTHL
jgi:hypothetical protein